MKKLSVIIPVFNEKDLIKTVIDKVLASPIEKEIIIIDDNSTDGTKEILKTINNDLIKKIFFESNKGKGAAVREAFKYVTGDAVIIQDADLEYDPNEYIDIVSPIFEGKSNVVYGLRFLNKKMKGLKLNILGNRFFNWFSNKCNKQDLSDANTCYIAFNSKLLNKLNLKENGFAFNPEITSEFARLNENIIEVPISYYPRTISEGKKIRFKHAFRHVKIMWKHRIK